MQLPVGMVFASSSMERTLKKPRVTSAWSSLPDPRAMADNMMADPHLRRAVMCNLDADSRRGAVDDLFNLMDDEEYVRFAADHIVPGVCFQRRPE